jgi:hypothetical protein
MGLRERLQDALGLDGSAGPSTSAAGRSWAAPPGPNGEPEPTTTLPLFVHRMNRLTADDWRRIEEAWNAVSRDPTGLAARSAAEQRAEEIGRANHRTVEVTSEVHVEFPDALSRVLGQTPTVRRRVDSMRTELEARSAIRRDALVALNVREWLEPVDFMQLYAPFEPFIPRADLERDATDWAKGGEVPAPRLSVDPATPGAEIGSSLTGPDLADAAPSPDPWRDVRWSDQEPSPRG